MQFDPYHRWLGIPKSEQPADCYRLLGLVRFEDDLDVIRDAAERQTTHVRGYAKSEHREAAANILNELARAELTLTDPKRRADYDAQLREQGTANAKTVNHVQSEAAHQLAKSNLALDKPAADVRNCPRCGNQFMLRREQIGKRMRCTKCRLEFVGGNEQKEAEMLNLLSSIETLSDEGIFGVEELAVVKLELPPLIPVKLPRGYGKAVLNSNTKPHAINRPSVRKWSTETKFVVIVAVVACSLSLVLLVSLVIAGVKFAGKLTPEDFAGAYSSFDSDGNKTATPSEVKKTNEKTVASSAIPNSVDRPAPLSSPFSSENAKDARDRWAKYYKTTSTIQSSTGISLILIPPGKFKMGSLESEPNRSDDEFQHEVEISKPFFIGVFEVTQQEYEKVMGTNPSYFCSKGSGKERVAGMDTRQFPTESVSWDDAQDFIKALNAKERGSGRRYRLPTEAEWEYACRAGTQSPFSFGNRLNGDNANCDGNFPFGTTTKGKFLSRPARVGSYSANAFGVYDMHGNVREWCQDWYEKRYYAQVSGTAAIDPPGPDTGSSRVLRGGSWGNYAVDCRSADRYYYDPSFRSFDGFRVVCELE